VPCERRFYEEKGLVCTLTSRILNVATLGFTVAFSGFLLLFVDWAAVRHGCPVEDECDFVKLAVFKYPLEKGPGPMTAALVSGHNTLLRKGSWHILPSHLHPTARSENPTASSVTLFHNRYPRRR
jgi:hypothetical protein